MSPWKSRCDIPSGTTQGWVCHPTHFPCSNFRNPKRLTNQPFIIWYQTICCFMGCALWPCFVRQPCGQIVLTYSISLLYFFGTNGGIHCIKWTIIGRRSNQGDTEPQPTKNIIYQINPISFLTLCFFHASFHFNWKFNGKRSCHFPCTSQVRISLGFKSYLPSFALYPIIST